MGFLKTNLCKLQVRYIFLWIIIYYLHFSTIITLPFLYVAQWKTFFVLNFLIWFSHCRRHFFSRRAFPLLNGYYSQYPNLIWLLENYDFFFLPTFWFDLRYVLNSFLKVCVSPWKLHVLKLKSNLINLILGSYLIFMKAIVVLNAHSRSWC